MSEKMKITWQDQLGQVEGIKVNENTLTIFTKYDELHFWLKDAEKLRAAINDAAEQKWWPTEKEENDHADHIGLNSKTDVRAYTAGIKKSE
ncbi:hypothetical protein TDB9533_01258 [Thalassocella blandensis]|nr:hypothetical protein TDB9533_01258 [Thalassocella blandensis]